MSNKPANMPADFESALGYLMSVSTPTVDDFKLMAYVEAGGEAFYAGLANGAPNPQIADLLNANGREERAHAHRVRRVVEKLLGESFDVPEPADNPYYVKPEGVPIDEDFLKFIIEAENGGDALYQGWANSVDDEECAELLRQNGKEEVAHGERAKEMMALL